MGMKRKEIRKNIKKNKKHKKYHYTTTTTTTENCVISRKTYKFLGFCECSGCITDGDLKGKRKYECPVCGKIESVKNLSKEILKLKNKKYSSKKDYLEDTVNVDINEMIGNDEDEIKPEN